MQADERANEMGRLTGRAEAQTASGRRSTRDQGIVLSWPQSNRTKPNQTPYQKRDEVLANRNHSLPPPRPSSSHPRAYTRPTMLSSQCACGKHDEGSRTYHSPFPAAPSAVCRQPFHLPTTTQSEGQPVLLLLLLLLAAVGAVVVMMMSVKTTGSERGSLRTTPPQAPSSSHPLLRQPTLMPMPTFHAPCYAPSKAQWYHDTEAMEGQREIRVQFNSMVCDEFFSGCGLVVDCWLRPTLPFTGAMPSPVCRCLVCIR